LVDARAKAAVADELARGGEAADVAEFGGDRVGEHPADPGHGAEQQHVVVVSAEAAQLALALSYLTVELVDQPQARLDRALPRLRQTQPGEELAAADAEEVGDRARLAVGEQHRVHRCFKLERSRTRCSRQRARSRSARTRGSGS
jgi:hypothetical protein